MKLRLLFFLLVPISLSGQWNYVGLIGDDCVPKLNAKYTFTNYDIGSHGHGYYIYKDGVIVNSGSGDFGCCYIRNIFALSDSVIFKIVAESGLAVIYRSINSGNTWTKFGGVQIWPVGLIFLNINTGYVLSQFPNDDSHVWLFRVSDVKSRNILSGDSIKLSSNLVEINDTIYGAPKCSNLHSTGFRIQKNGINIDYKINLFSEPLKITDNYISNELRIYPIPISDILNLEIENESTIKILDEQGRVIYEQKCKFGKNKINMNNFKSGLYFLVSKDKYSTKMTKLLKK